MIFVITCFSTFFWDNNSLDRYYILKIWSVIKEGIDKFPPTITIKSPSNCMDLIYSISYNQNQIKNGFKLPILLLRKPFGDYFSFKKSILDLLCFVYNL